MSWPHDISIDAFETDGFLEESPCGKSVFEMHKDKMQIKNAKVAIPNLEKIFTATFKLSSSKGFQAMSLRDLSKETGIMGGLYSYIGSKNDLASVIEGVQRKYIEQVADEILEAKLEPKECLRGIILSEIYMMEILRSGTISALWNSKDCLKNNKVLL